MKKIALFSVYLLLLVLLITGCGEAKGSASDDIPSLAELLEINDLNQVLNEHANVYVNSVSKSSNLDYDYTEEVIYVKIDEEICYHKRGKDSSEAPYDYTSNVGNAYYYSNAEGIVAMVADSAEAFSDYTLDFSSTPIGVGYIEKDQIVYHSYTIYEADEMFAASRFDYTLYFDAKTKLLEQLDYVLYDEGHQISADYSATISYDVSNIDDKFDKTAYEIITTSDRMIELEIIAKYNTPEQASYHFVATTDAELYAMLGYTTHMLYTDPECKNMVSTLDAYTGTKSMTLYAKPMEILD